MSHVLKGLVFTKTIEFCNIQGFYFSLTPGQSKAYSYRALLRYRISNTLGTTTIYGWGYSPTRRWRETKTLSVIKSWWVRFSFSTNFYVVLTWKGLVHPAFWKKCCYKYFKGKSSSFLQNIILSIAKSLVLFVKEYTSIEQLSFSDSWGSVLSSWSKLKFDRCYLCCVLLKCPCQKGKVVQELFPQEHKT